MSRYDDSTGTLLYFPDAAASALTDAERGVLQKAGLQLLDQDPRYVNNPLAWLDATGTGLVLRLYDAWGGLNWDDPDQIEAVWTVAEAACLRSRNRWYALCNYQGYEDECREVREHADFASIRSEMARLNERRQSKKKMLRVISPDECVVHKVWGPPWTPDQ